MAMEIGWSQQYPIHEMHQPPLQHQISLPREIELEGHYKEILLYYTPDGPKPSSYEGPPDRMTQQAGLHLFSRYSSRIPDIQAVHLYLLHKCDQLTLESNHPMGQIIQPIALAYTEELLTPIGCLRMVGFPVCLVPRLGEMTPESLHLVFDFRVVPKGIPSADYAELMQEWMEKMQIGEFMDDFDLFYAMRNDEIKTADQRWPTERFLGYNALMQQVKGRRFKQ